MSAQLVPVSENNAAPPGVSIGGMKPLHRFLKGRPKIMGIITLVMGLTSFTVSIVIMTDTFSHLWTVIQPGLLEGVLYILCGILYILTEHNTTKKTVTISLALSIIAALGTGWTILHILPSVIHGSYYRYYEYNEDNTTETEEEKWAPYYASMGESVEAILLFYSFVGGIIVIVMSILAGSALRSSKSQAMVVMMTTAPEAPVE